MPSLEIDDREPPPTPQTSNFNESGNNHQNNITSVDNVTADAALIRTNTTNHLSNNQKKGTTKLLPSNPWETLDPHDPEDIPEKVPKKGRDIHVKTHVHKYTSKKGKIFKGSYKQLTCAGRTWKLPFGVTLPNSKTSKNTQTTKPLLFSKMATTSLIDHPLLVDYTKTNYLMGPFFVEFQYLYDVEMKKRTQEIKHSKQNRTIQVNKQLSFSQFISLLMFLF
jgi:hypothetical protein